MQLLIGKVKYYQPFIMTISQLFKLGSLKTRGSHIEDELPTVIYLVAVVACRAIYIERYYVIYY